MDSQQPATVETAEDKPGCASVNGSPAHVHFEITTPKGRRAMVLGDPSMSEKTRAAMGAMIDAAADCADQCPKTEVQENAERSNPAPKS